MKVGKVEDMWDTFLVMKKRGIVPTNLSLHTVITGLLNVDRIDDVFTTFEELKVNDAKVLGNFYIC
jgi:pentatricopeptide repeat protein